MGMLNLSSSLRKSKRVQGTKNVRHYVRSNQLHKQLLGPKFLNWCLKYFIRCAGRKQGVSCSLLLTIPKADRLRVLKRYEIILKIKFNLLI